MNRTPFRSLTALLLLSLPAATVLAQANQPVRGGRPAQNPPEATQPQTTPPEGDSAVTVSVRHDIAPLGVTIFLPDGAIAELTSFQGTRSRAVIRDQANTWVIQIYDDIELTQTSIDQIIDVFIERQRSGQSAVDPQTGSQMRFEVAERSLANGELIVAGQQAGRVYGLFPNARNIPVSGFTVFEPQPGRFVVFQLSAARELFARVRPLYETIVASAQFVDPTVARADLAAAKLTAEAFFADITSQDLETALPSEPSFIRIYEPSSTGDPMDAREVAYQKVELRLGQAGELTPERARTSWSPEEREVGFLARVDARVISGDTEMLSRGIFFLSRDRRRELWNVTNVVKVGQASNTVEQTLVRDGDRLTVSTNAQNADTAVSDWDLDKISPIYLSRFELFLLPHLIAQRSPEPGSPAVFDFAFYTYEPSVERLTVRRDRFQSIPTGGWNYSSKPHLNADDVQATLDIHGNVIRRTLAGGQVAERSTAARIRDLWQRKGLISP